MLNDALNVVWRLEIARDPGIASDCSYRHAHRPHHVPHPLGGRVVCLVCHPPAGVVPVTLLSLSESQVGLARHDAPDTNREAAVNVFPRSGTQRKRVLAAIWRADVLGATRDEIANRLEASPNTVRPRVKELIDGGWVTATGRTRPTDMGRPAEVLELTDAAKNEIAERISRKEDAHAAAA